MEIAYLIYLGKDKGTLPGVPARNLTKEETDKHGGEEFLLQTKLYAYATKNEPVIKRKTKRRVNNGE